MKPLLSSSFQRQKTSLLFSNSHFSKFLHSTISISANSYETPNKANLLSSSEDEIKPRIFNREKIENTIYSNEDILLKAINCFFIECTEPMSGGGIDMICEESSLYVIKCCFVNCYAQIEGGAISYFGNVFNVTDTCFDGCYTMDSGMAMEIYVKGTKEKIYMNGLSITNCADKASFVPKREEKSDDSKGRFDDGVGQFGVYLSNVIEMTRGKQKLIAVNSTNNIVHLTGGFCLSEESRSFSLSYSTIVDNIADALFSLYDILLNKGNMSSCNILNNTGSLSLNLFDLDNSSMNAFDCTFLQNNMSFVASNGNLHFENCAYDFNGKNPPLENAEFTESGSIFNKLKNWRSVKTKIFDQAQISNNDKIFSRCRKNKPRYSRNNNALRNNRFRDPDFYDNDNIFDLKDKKDEENNQNNKGEEIDINNFKDKHDIFNGNKKEDKEDNKDNKVNNDIFNNLKNNNNNSKNNNKNNDEDDDEEEENDKNDKNDKNKNKNNKNEFDNFNNKINIADNEEEEEEDNKKQNTNEINNTPNRSWFLLITLIFMILIGGIFAFVYVFYIKDKERDINQLQDVEML